MISEIAGGILGWNRPVRSVSSAEAEQYAEACFQANKIMKKHGEASVKKVNGVWVASRTPTVKGD